MIAEIKIGDTLVCANCGKYITLTDKTFLLDAFAEYVNCNHCGVKVDVQYYHRFGTKVNNGG